MARYVNDVQTQVPIEHAMSQVEAYLNSQGFSRKPDGVWQKGMGLLTGPQFIFVAPGQGFVRVEAWIKFALLPGVYIGEMGIDGFFAFVLKKMLRGRVETVEGIVRQG